MLASFQRHHYSGFEPLEAFDVVYGGHFEHRLLEVRRSTMVHQRLILGNVRLESGSYNFPVNALGAMPSESICIGFVADGLSATRFNTQLASDHTVQIYYPSAELMYHTSGPSTWINFTASHDILARAIEHLPGRKSNERKVGVRSIAVCPKKRRQLQQLVTDAFVLAYVLQAQGISRELADEMAAVLTAGYVGLLLSAPAAHTDSSKAADLRASLIRACEELILTPQGMQWDLPDLAQRTGYSLRSLERIFQQGVGMSPGRWFRTIRLNRALRDLLMDSSTSSVTDVATRWGFLHLSRFSDAYREAFGELPSETLQRSRDRRRSRRPQTPL